MRLYRTADGLARGEGGELLLLDLPHPDIGALLADDIELARGARVTRRIPEAEASLLAPEAAPGTVVIGGASYLDHIVEAGMPMPGAPVFITITGDQVVGPNSVVELPAEAPDRVDYEAELVIVIGKAGSDIPIAEAWSHVAGFTAVNDVSARDVQLEGMTDGVITDVAKMARGKTFPTFKPMGPALVTVDEFAQPLDLSITTRINGELRQNGRTSKLLFSVPQFIQTVSASVPLAVGDVILTGSPAGIALATGKYLRAGDVIDIEIEGIGQLHNKVVANR
jgi:2-keto-4-pentenoate hydratase/2-oxohepta-3-ene-1,7-dioic acid hydratase in catechol pathway